MCEAQMRYSLFQPLLQILVTRKHSSGQENTSRNRSEKEFASLDKKGQTGLASLLFVVLKIATRLEAGVSILPPRGIIMREGDVSPTL